MDSDGNAVIIEIKRGMSPREVIAQALDYAVWAESAGYDKLNAIAKKKHLAKHGDLYGLFRSKLNSVPEPWNVNQKIRIVAERIDEKTRAMARYLRGREVDIKCAELNFYGSPGKEIVSVDFVVGDPSDAMDELGEKPARTWDDKRGEKPARTWNDTFHNADKDNRAIVSDLISAVKKRLKPQMRPQSQFYYMRVPKKAKKSLFGAITCYKTTAHVSFRVDPDTFQHDDNPKIRIGHRWFFTEDTERRIKLTKPNFDLILRCLEHAHEATSKL